VLLLLKIGTLLAFVLLTKKEMLYGKKKEQKVKGAIQIEVVKI